MCLREWLKNYNFGGHVLEGPPFWYRQSCQILPYLCVYLPKKFRGPSLKG